MYQCIRRWKLRPTTRTDNTRFLEIHRGKAVTSLAQCSWKQCSPKRQVIQSQLVTPMDTLSPSQHPSSMMEESTQTNPTAVPQLSPSLTASANSSSLPSPKEGVFDTRAKPLNSKFPSSDGPAKRPSIRRMSFHSDPLIRSYSSLQSPPSSPPHRFMHRQNSRSPVSLGTRAASGQKPRYLPYSPRSGTIPPGLHFAAWALGLSSPTHVTLEEVKEICCSMSSVDHVLTHFCYYRKRRISWMLSLQYPTGFCCQHMMLNERIMIALHAVLLSYQWKSNLPNDDKHSWLRFVNNMMGTWQSARNIWVFSSACSITVGYLR